MINFTHNPSPIRQQAAYERHEAMIEQDMEAVALIRDLIANIELEAMAIRHHLSIVPTSDTTELFRNSVAQRAETIKGIADNLNANGVFKRIVQDYAKAWAVENLSVHNLPEAIFGSSRFQKLLMAHATGNYNHEYGEGYHA